MGLRELVEETVSSPVDLFLLGVIGYVIFRILRRQSALPLPFL